MAAAAVLFLSFVLLERLERKETKFLATLRLKISLWPKLCYDNMLLLCLGVKICSCVCVSDSELRQGMVVISSRERILL